MSTQSECSAYVKQRPPQPETVSGAAAAAARGKRGRHATGRRVTGLSRQHPEYGATESACAETATNSSRPALRTTARRSSAEQCLKSVDRPGKGRTFPGDRLKVPS